MAEDEGILIAPINYPPFYLLYYKRIIKKEVFKRFGAKEGEGYPLIRKGAQDLLYLKISCYNVACAFQRNIYIVSGNYGSLQQHVVHPVSLPLKGRRAACCAWKRNMIRLIIRMSALQKHSAFKVLLDLVRQFSDDPSLKVSVDYTEDD